LRGQKESATAVQPSAKDVATLSAKAGAAEKELAIAKAHYDNILQQKDEV